MFRYTFITLAITLLIGAMNPFLVESLKLSYFDFLQRSHEPAESEQIVLVDIDEGDILNEGQWPWPRDIMAKYVDQIPPNNIIVLNVVYGEDDRFKQDEVLFKSMMQKMLS